MNKQQVIDKLTNHRLSDTEKETLNQYLHYLNVEAINGTSTASKKPRSRNNKRSTQGPAVSKT
jgi:hypothetical protein